MRCDLLPVAMRCDLLLASLFVLQFALVFASAGQALQACKSSGSEWWSSSEGAEGLFQIQAVATAAKVSSAGYSTDADADSNKPLIFVKTHHTGSTTMTSIFQRYCDAHNVTCAPDPPYKFSGKNVDQQDLAKYVADHAGKDKIDVWPWHVFYVRESFEKLMPGALTISIFREPESRLVSALSHSQWTAEKLHQVLHTLETNGNLTLEDYGSKYGMQPECGARQHWHVPSLADLDLVLLFEDYNRSLVLMANKLGWSLKDILYISQRVSKNSDEQEVAIDKLKAYIEQPLWKMTEAGKKFVTSCIEDDKPLYNKVKERYQQQLSSLTPVEHAKVENDIHRLQSAVKDLQACCHSHRDDSYCHVLGENAVKWHHRHAAGRGLPEGVFATHCYLMAVKTLER